MTWVIISLLVPRLGTNMFNYNPNDLIKSTITRNDKSCKSFYLTSKSVQKTLSHLREYFGSHKLIKHHLEEIHMTNNNKHAVQTMLIELRKHTSTFGDVTKKTFPFLRS